MELRWIGLLFIMAIVIGPPWDSFFSNKSVDAFSDAPFRIVHEMSKKRFNKILSEIRYKNSKAPPYKDRFWYIRDLMNVWNKPCRSMLHSSQGAKTKTWIPKDACSGSDKQRKLFTREKCYESKENQTSQDNKYSFFAVIAFFKKISLKQNFKIYKQISSSHMHRWT